MPDLDDWQELVSVVIPAYNAELTVGETLASARAQTHRHLDIIVVDDGSSDETAAVVEAVATEDARVRLLRQTNRGVAAARNRGILEARGNLIAILDADDLWHPTKIAKQVTALRQRGAEVGLVYTWYREIDGAGRILSSPSQPPYEGDVYAPLVLSNFLGGGSTALMRRACLREVGGFDSRFQGPEDTELFLRIAERYDIGLVPEFLMGYRLSAGSLSGDVWRMLRQKELVIAEARQRHPELPRQLFRWARGECSLWLARESLGRGRFGTGMYLMMRTLLYDPPAVLRPSTGRTVLHGLRKQLSLPPVRPAASRLLARFGVGRERHASTTGGCVGQLFLATAPERDSSAPQRSSRNKRFETRRLAAATSWRIRRPPPDRKGMGAPDLARSASR